MRRTRCPCSPLGSTAPEMSPTFKIGRSTVYRAIERQRHEALAGVTRRPTADRSRSRAGGPQLTPMRNTRPTRGRTLSPARRKRRSPTTDPTTADPRRIRRNVDQQWSQQRRLRRRRFPQAAAKAAAVPKAAVAVVVAARAVVVAAMDLRSLPRQRLARPGTRGGTVDHPPVPTGTPEGGSGDDGGRKM